MLQTPVGDLLVSFTKDQGVLDDALPDAIYYAGIYAFILIATTITVSITIPLFSVLAGGLFLMSGFMLRMYMPAATHLKKLRMGTSGDVVTLVAEALDGLGVIQAYNKQAYFTTVTSKYIDDSHRCAPRCGPPSAQCPSSGRNALPARCWALTDDLPAAARRALFGAESLNLWLAYYCDFYGAIMVLSVACFGVGQWKTLGSGSVGLAFSQSIQMLVFYTWSIRLLADTIGLFGSAEKLTWIANHAPQESGRLAPPSPAGKGAPAGSDDSAEAGCCGGSSSNGTVGVSLPAPLSRVRQPAAACLPTRHCLDCRRAAFCLTARPALAPAGHPANALPHASACRRRRRPSCTRACPPTGPAPVPSSSTRLSCATRRTCRPPCAASPSTSSLATRWAVGSASARALHGLPPGPLWSTATLPETPVPSSCPRPGRQLLTAPACPSLPSLPAQVGVVGRTGSGKSTLLLALYRMFNLDTGSIKLDDVDISTITLNQLRNGLSVIPQEPVVFSGTVRSNLDPFGEFGHDNVLWQALRDCGIEEAAKREGGLDAKLDGTGGQAWSLGQQQLMCLARAALKKVPVLCLDEATASMDPHTEAEVLEIIERLFSERTTFTIAHRSAAPLTRWNLRTGAPLASACWPGACTYQPSTCPAANPARPAPPVPARLDNVIRSDQVIVMDAGVVAEIGPPSVLLANPDSAFSSLVDRTGAAGAAALRQMAADFFKERAEGQRIGGKHRPSFEGLRRASIEVMKGLARGSLARASLAPVTAPIRE